MYINNLRVSETRANARAGVRVLYKRNWGHIFILKDILNFHRMRWAEHVSRTGKRTGEYRDLVGKPVGKRPLERLSIDGRKIL
jgi:hypothetical protein